MKIHGICSKIIILSLLCAASPLFSETFRVRKLFPIKLTGTIQNEQTFVTGINDCIAIFLPDDRSWLEGIEIKIAIPEAVAAWQDSVALSLYDNITPLPSSSQIDYGGTRSFVKPLPARLSWIIRIPLSASVSFKESAYETKIGVVPDTKRGFVFVRLQPAMKGVPDETINAELKITVKPILINKGKLCVSVTAPNGDTDPYTLFIDGAKTAADANGYTLTPGTHDVNIVSDFYRDEMRTVRIDRAKTTELRVALKSLAPTLLVTSPANASVYVDGRHWTTIGKEIEISEGEHTVRFVMGDYEIMRTVNAQKGKSYTVSIAVDLKINEE